MNDSEMAPGRIDVHPFHRRTAYLPTVALEALAGSLQSWLDNGLPGAMIDGRPRYGKSYAIAYIRQNTELCFGTRIPSLKVDVVDASRNVVTEGNFFGGMLRKIGYSRHDSGTAMQKKYRLIGMMQEAALDLPSGRFLLFMDESQHLTRARYSYLVNLQNELEDVGVSLFTVLMGQPELRAQRETYRSAGQTQITGRFMTAVHTFEGVRRLEDLAYICHAIDAKTEWPASSGMSFSRYYAPRAYDAGWRLAREAPLIWRTLDERRIESGLSTTRSLTMQAVMALLRWLMKTARSIDASGMRFDETMVRTGYDCVAALQISDDLRAPDDPDDELGSPHESDDGPTR